MPSRETLRTAFLTSALSVQNKAFEAEIEHVIPNITANEICGEEMKSSKIILRTIFIAVLVVACGSNENQNTLLCGGSGGPVAPNNALITATVLEVQYPSSNETRLRLYINKSENIGTEINMTTANTEIVAVARNQILDIQTNNTITATATLAGDECGTVWLIANVAKI